MDGGWWRVGWNKFRAAAGWNKFREAKSGWGSTRAAREVCDLKLVGLDALLFRKREQRF